MPRGSKNAIDCDNDDAYAFFIGLFDANEFRFDRLREWLGEHVRSQ